MKQTQKWKNMRWMHKNNIRCRACLQQPNVCATEQKTNQILKIPTQKQFYPYSILESLSMLNLLVYFLILWKPNE